MLQWSASGSSGGAPFRATEAEASTPIHMPAAQSNQRLNVFRMDRVLGYFRMDCVLKYQYPFRFRLPFPSPFQWGQAMTDADCVLNWYCQFPRR